MAEIMTKGGTFAFTVTVPNTAIAPTLAGWTPHASMRKGRAEDSDEILNSSQLVASVQDSDNRVILVKASAAITATVVDSGWVDVWIVQDAANRYKVRTVRVILDPRISVIP